MYHKLSVKLPVMAICHTYCISDPDYLESPLFLLMCSKEMNLVSAFLGFVHFTMLLLLMYNDTNRLPWWLGMS